MKQHPTEHFSQQCTEQKPTYPPLEEVLTLVSFIQNECGEWQVYSVYGDVYKHVNGSVHGNVMRNVNGFVLGKINGRQWKSIMEDNND